jgi:hypothetical protein
MDDRKIKSMQKFIEKLGSIIGVDKGKITNSSQQSYSNLSTVDQHKSMDA